MNAPILSWVHITPLGNPVVPEEHKIVATVFLRSICGGLKVSSTSSTPITLLLLSAIISSVQFTLNDILKIYDPR